MLKKSNSFSEKNKARANALTEPFDKPILDKARKIAKTYSMMLHPNPKLGFVGTSIELPMVFADGKTVEQCCNSMREALTVAVATMIECGQSPPSPASEKKRNIQMNIRLTAEEKVKLTMASRNLGFNGVSDFVRYAALKEVASESKPL
jgi:predicted RNase H-like HicB family nuclease